MYAFPKGWFKAHIEARDTEAVFQWLVRDNERRVKSGLPGFTPSYELAAKIAEVKKESKKPIDKPEVSA